MRINGGALEITSDNNIDFLVMDKLVFLAVLFEEIGNSVST
jgi:hypothetical protein